MFEVSFYTSIKNISPILEFLNSSNIKLRSKILRKLKYVQEYGLTSAVPDLKKIKNTPLWELRVLGRDNVRLLCVNCGKDKIKVLHVFVKKKQKTPLNEIQIALKRYTEIIDK